MILIIVAFAIFISRFYYTRAFLLARRCNISILDDADDYYELYSLE
jgi:hypothetical protein